MTDPTLLRMALIGYETERAELLQKMAEIQKQLGGASTIAIASATVKPRRKMSAAARKRIAAAQKKRWKEFHAKKKAE